MTPTEPTPARQIPRLLTGSLMVLVIALSGLSVRLALELRAAVGRVTEGWVGAYRDQTADAAEAFFGVRLPGLTTIPGSQAGVR